ncbi:MAG: DUF4314 domain-containing protein [Nitrososphaeraceae archaeon]
MDNKLGPIRILIRVILSGRSKFSLVSKAIKPDVVGKRIELIRTNDPYTDLKPGDRGTVVDISELPYEDTPFKVMVQWDNGSRLAILEGHDDYRTVYDDDD